MNDDKFTSEIIGYWQEIFGHLIHWYDVADTKCAGIITISGILLSFVTLGSFLGTGNNTPQTNSPAPSKVTIYILSLFLFSVLSSVILAVISLWARISILPTKLRLQKKNLKNQKKISLVIL